MSEKSLLFACGFVLLLKAEIAVGQGVPAPDSLKGQSTQAQPIAVQRQSPLRPKVKVLFKGGGFVEGVLDRYVDGQYTIVQNDGQPRSFAESDAEWIDFSPVRSERLLAVRQRLLRAGPSGSDFWKDFTAPSSELRTKVVAELIEMLGDPEPAVRENAATFLCTWSGMTGCPQIPPELVIKALRDDSFRVHQWMPTVLCRLGESNDRVIEPIVETMLSDRRSSVAITAVDALSGIASRRAEGSPGLKRILDGLARAAVEHPLADVRAWAARALGTLRLKGLPAADALRRACQDPNEAVQKAARKARNQVGDTLREALRSRGTDEEVIAALLVFKARGNYHEERHRLLEAEQRLIAAGPKQIEALMTAVRLDDPDEKVHSSIVAAALAAWGEPILPELDKYAREKSVLVRCTVAEAFRHMALTSLPETLRMLAHDKDESVRAAAIYALAGHCHRTALSRRMLEGSLPLLVEALNDPRLACAYDAAASALEEIGPGHPEIVPSLLNVLKRSEDPGDRKRIIEALGRVAAKIARDEQLQPVIQALCDAVRDDPAAEVRAAAANHLGDLGPRARAALPVLQKAETDVDDSVVLEARDAAARIRQAKPVPSDQPVKKKKAGKADDDTNDPFS